MYGVLTADRDFAHEDIGDVVYYFAEEVSGQRHTPLSSAINSIACWGDTMTVREEPHRAAVTTDGTRATPDVEGHHWGTVCPTDPGYRAGLLDRIEEVGAVGDVRLTTLGFPGASFCHCDRCERRFTTSDHDDRDAWRTDIISEFVADATDRVKNTVIATLYPDPYPGNLRERVGVDPHALAPYVDGFLVPLCSISYETTYWVESLARGFARELDGLDVSLTLQLSAAQADVGRLIDLTRQVEPHADAIVYGTHRCDVDVVRETIQRLHTATASDEQPPTAKKESWILPRQRRQDHRDDELFQEKG